ncbi:MAG: hypothetical protein R3F49_17915 [Planctomycetota bacterium]
MSRTHLACLVVIAVAVAIGAQWGGRVGVGTASGALLGGAVALASHGLLGRSLKAEFETALAALLGAAALKLLVLFAAWAALTFVPALGQVADVAAFLLAYAAAILVVLGVGSFDHLRALAPKASATEPGESLL